MGEAETVPSDEKQAETGICTADESIVWSQEVEVCLFHAMLGHKPVGKMNLFMSDVNNRPDLCVWTPGVKQCNIINKHHVLLFAF